MRTVAAWRALIAVSLLTAPLADARAQQPEAPPTPRIAVGPFSVRPRLEIRDAGIDDNVFNDPEDPQRDFTATIAPRLDATLRMGWTRLNVGAFAHVVYFHEFTGERSVNRGSEARFEIGEGLLQPYLIGSITDTRERLNPEIDARARRRQSMYGGGLILALTSRTSLVLNARRASLAFEEGERFRGVDLARSLNERADTLDAGLRIDLTPLTAWETTVGVQHDRFTTDPLRDSDSRRVATALEFSPSALISGRASVGYRTFTPLDPSLAEFTGLVALVGAAYTLEDTKLEVTLERDVRYSFEERLPYYVTTNGRFTATQRIAGPVDVQGTIGRYVMSYRAFGGGPAEARRDAFTLYGGGIGYRLGEAVRLGVNVEWSRRRSDGLLDREYDRRRFSSSLTYGL